MLRMKRNFIGLALLATLFVGCQTAQKADDANTAETFPGYGSDRAPSSVTPIVEAVFKELRVVGSKAGAKTAEKNASKEFLTFLNTSVMASNDPSVALFRKEIRAERKAAGANKKTIDSLFSEEDLRRLPEHVQGELATKFVKAKAAKDMPSLSAFAAKVEGQYKAMAASDVRKVKGTSELLSTEKGNTSKFDARANASNQAKFDASTGAFNKESGEGYLKLRNKFDEIIGSQPTAELQTEARLASDKALKSSGRIYKLTGMTHLVEETCDNLDLAALKEYGRLLEKIENDIRKNYPIDRATGRIKCTNVAEITAFVAAEFQEGLGRIGISAWVAVEEMSACNYLNPKTATASRGLASERGNKLGAHPACK